MLLTPHILAGALVGGTLSSDPLTAIVFAFVTYFVLELIPHWDPVNVKRRSVKIIRYLDVAFSSIVLFVLAYIAFQPGSTLELTSNGLPVTLDIKSVIGGVVSLIIYSAIFLANEFGNENPTVSKITQFIKKINYSDRTIWGIVIQFAIPIMAITILFRLIDFPSVQKIVNQLGR